jgi:hypothetical protein
MIARTHLTHERGGDRRHARRCAPRCFSPFEKGHALLEHLYRGVGEARIDVALFLALEPRLGAPGGWVDKARAEKDRFGGFPMLAALHAAMHQERLRLAVLGVGERVA